MVCSYTDHENKMHRKIQEKKQRSQSYTTKGNNGAKSEEMEKTWRRERRPDNDYNDYDDDTLRGSKRDAPVSPFFSFQMFLDSPSSPTNQ